MTKPENARQNPEDRADTKMGHLICLGSEIPSDTWKFAAIFPFLPPPGWYKMKESMQGDEELRYGMRATIVRASEKAYEKTKTEKVSVHHRSCRYTTTDL